MSLIDARSLRGADCDTNHYLVVAKVSKRLAVCKQVAQKIDGEIFNIRKLNKREIKKQNQIEISNRFAALENLRDGEDIIRAWKDIKENIKTLAKQSLGMHELMQHKPWFDEEFIEFLDQRNHPKIQCVQDTSQSCGVDNQNNVRGEAITHFRKKEEYLKAKLE